ncbi:MAG: DUF1292 domain-containing protein [Eubacteriales bacterium]|nr:DUF1292 domain-containing protein [Eubacteriales bacterium]
MSEEVNEKLIELTDEATGEKVVFEHLDSIEYKDRIYYVLTEYLEDEAETSDVYVMQFIELDDGNETLEVVEDEDVINHVFDEFKERTKDKYEFLE